MIVIRHDDKRKQFHPPICTKIMKAVNQNAYDDVSIEKMHVLDGVRGDEVKIIGVEVRFERHILSRSSRVCDPAGVLHNTVVADPA